MDNYKTNNLVCPSTVKKVFDCDNNITMINSTLSINFDLCDGITLPKNSKIEILETHVICNISHIEKEILVNGRKIDCEKSSLYDSICIKDDLINLPKDNKNKILLSIAEPLKLKVDCSIEIKALAHTLDHQQIYIKAIGKCVDSIDTILLSRCCIPYSSCDFDEIYLDINNYLNTIANPDYIFLSPLYNSCCHIDKFLGKVFLNYEIGSESMCYRDVRKCFYSTLPQYTKKHYYKKTLKIN